jgi:hypothetical protein
MNAIWPFTSLDAAALHGEKLLERLERAVGTQEGLEKVLGALGAQGVKPELGVVGLAPPAVPVLGPVVDEQEHLGGGQTLDEGIEEDLGFGVDPMQVLNEQHERLDLALPEQQVLDGVQCPLPALPGIEPPPRLILDRNL